MNHVINSFQERFAQPDFKIYLQLQKYFLLKDIARKLYTPTILHKNPYFTGF